jgi:hypothetical protein
MATSSKIVSKPSLVDDADLCAFRLQDLQDYSKEISSGEFGPARIPSVA